MKRRIITLIAMLTFAAMQSPAMSIAADDDDPIGADLRDVTVGMKIADLPDAGYVNLVCAADTAKKLPGWGRWKECPADQAGLRAIRYGFDPETSKDGTMVAGHPVLLTLSADAEGRVAALQIETDSKAPLRMRKKAFLLAGQAKSRYGDENWSCTQDKAAAGESPVGGIFLKEHCSKTVAGRAITVDRNLYRRGDQDMKNFVDDARITIRRAGS